MLFLLTGFSFSHLEEPVEVQIVLCDVHVQVFVVSPHVMLSPALFSSVVEPGMKHKSLHAHGDVWAPLCLTMDVTAAELLSPAVPQGLGRQDFSLCLCQTWLF